MTRLYSNKIKLLLVLVPVFAVVLIDQIVKYRIRTEFELGESLPVIEDVFHITYVRNTGAAFSLFKSMPFMTIVIPCLLLLGCVVAMGILYKKDMPAPMVLVGLIFAGGIGNMIDRVALGYVVDMIDFRFFPVFNVADIAVTCGCVLLMIWAFVSERKTSEKI